ncbi:BRO family protein [Salinicoccus roseus]|uniref:BRO family protein n=1 Tax=Salinicoccus roseus TaxID=45670 RepID=UPI0023008CBD|nr:BRO family protein [Salinicoccus roseus]
MNELQVFNFEETDVRTVVVEDEPWFVAKDVADILGYKNSRKALADHVDEEDKLASPVVTAGQRRHQTIINESGLYALIFGSSLESAKRFKRWVTSEVLPTIRQTGKYEAPKDPMEIMKLQFEALENTNKKVSKIEDKVVYLENEVRIEAGDYGHLGKRIGQKVQAAIRNYNLLDHNDVRKELYKDINSSINRITGVRTRSQLRQKHFDTVLQFINEWEPSSATRYKVREIAERIDTDDQRDSSAQR